ncbi:MAG: hypothetical protein J5825_06550 [Lachnospiraceae bacterium]|nr:hypothetical protein [Lachnospiraceae bacterium]
MKGQDLFEAMGKISDRYIEEAAPDEKTLAKNDSGKNVINISEAKRSSRRKWYQNPRVLGGLATAVALILLTVIVLPKVNLITSNGAQYASAPSHTKEGGSYNSGAEYKNSGVAKEEQDRQKSEDNVATEKATMAGNTKEEYEEEIKGINFGQYAAFPILSNTYGNTGTKHVSSIACVVDLKKEKSVMNVSYTTTLGQTYSAKSSSFSKQTLSSFLKSTDVFATGTNAPTAINWSSHSDISLSDLVGEYQIYGSAPVSERLTADLTLEEFLTDDDEEVIILVMDFQEDSLSYLVKRSTDPDVQELFEWYHDKCLGPP